jgi:hypothetical protein
MHHIHRNDVLPWKTMLPIGTLEKVTLSLCSPSFPTGTADLHHPAALMTNQNNLRKET